MNLLKLIIPVFVIFLSWQLVAQEVISTPERTPEEEATSQTERMQQELQLTTEQVKKVYEINLKYARERQISNSRTEAVERSKNKEAELKKVLTDEQFARLQNKRYEQSNYQTGSGGVVPATGSSFRPPVTSYRTRQPVNTQNNLPTGGTEYRSGYRPAQNNPVYQNYQRPTTASGNGNSNPSTNNTQRSVPPPANSGTYRATPPSNSSGTYRATPPANNPPTRNYNSNNQGSTPVTPSRPNSSSSSQGSNRR